MFVIHIAILHETPITNELYTAVHEKLARGILRDPRFRDLGQFVRTQVHNLNVCDVLILVVWAEFDPQQQPGEICHYINKSCVAQA